MSMNKPEWERILSAENLNTFYGKSHILFDVSFTVKKGEILCVMGRNGAGKSTTFKSLVMLNPPKTGIVTFMGRNITGLRPHHVARMGIGFVPEDRRIFSNLTVLENLLLGASTGRSGIWNLSLIHDFFPVLREYESRLGGTLSGGEQQMLTIARTLMGNPEVLLLDEPTEGLSPVMVKTLRDLVLRVKEAGTTIVLAEQNIVFAMEVADRVVVLDMGYVRYKNDIESFREADHIRKAYLAI